MGVVYKAEDTKLDRTVALKFLAAHLLNDDEAKQRFLREAKAAAALHHPNICTVYEVDEADGKTFLAMALLEGEALEDRIDQGPLPLKDALEIGRQAAEGLEAAHEKGIVHRDIKPANIMVDAKRRATLMDFGLARLTEASKLTRQDQTVGTAAYMSPEQIQGLEVDQRTDIWALGCVLYEMVTGVRPFKGQYDQALAYEIVHEEPEPLTAVRTGVPMELEFIVGKCLAKDAEARYADAGEIAKDLRTLGEKLKSGRSTVLNTSPMTVVPAEAPIAEPPPGAPSSAASPRRWQLLAAVLGLAVLALLFVTFRSPIAAPVPEPREVVRFSFAHEGVEIASISPDGRHIVFAARTEGDAKTLWLRSLESETTRELPGTSGVTYVVEGWSHDSRSIVFGTQRQLKRIAIDGSDPVVLAELPDQSGFTFLGATYSQDGGKIVFSSGLKLWELPAHGGTPQLLFEPEPGTFYWSPRFLPVGGGSRYLLHSASTSNQRRLAVFDLDSGESHDVGPGSNASYVPSGFLVHDHGVQGQPGLFAMPFSAADLSSSGDSFPIAEDGTFASVSRNGTLVYRDYEIPAGGAQIVVRDRNGKRIRSVGDPIATGSHPVVSPDGRRVLANVDRGLRVYDLDRNIGVQIAPHWSQTNPAVWLASGDEVAFVGANGRLRSQDAHGGSQPTERSDVLNTFAISFSLDGRYAVHAGPDPGGGEGGIWYRTWLPDGRLSEPVSWLRTPAGENQPEVSPNGQYLAYRSDANGRNEIYVRPFPSGTGKWIVSNNGGHSPRWSPESSELFYLEGSTLMAAPVSTDGDFTVGSPQRLFESADLAGRTTPGKYDVFPDGRSFIMIHEEDPDARESVLRVVQNWDAPYVARQP